MTTRSWRTRTMQAISRPTALWLALVLGFVLPVGGAIAYFLYDLFDVPAPVVHHRVTLPNPAGSFVAVIEQLDAMDINAGELNVVHVLRRGGAVDERGDRSKTIIFYNDADNPAPDVRWTDNTHLSVSYAGGKASPFMRAGRDGMIVTYKRRADQ